MAKSKKGRMIQLSFTALCHKLCQFSYLLSYLLSYLSSSGWGIHRFLPLLRCGPRNQVLGIRGIWGRFLREVSSKKWCVFVAGNFNFWKNPKILPLSYCGLVLRYLCAFRRNDCCLFFDWKQGQTKPIHLGYLADWKVWLMAPFGILLMWDADVPVQTVIHWPCGSV